MSLYGSVSASSDKATNSIYSLHVASTRARTRTCIMRDCTFSVRTRTSPEVSSFLRNISGDPHSTSFSTLAFSVVRCCRFMDHKHLQHMITLSTQTGVTAMYHYEVQVRFVVGIAQLQATVFAHAASFVAAFSIVEENVRQSYPNAIDLIATRIISNPIH